MLEVLAAAPNGLTVTELSTVLEVNRTVVYRLISTLEQHGLVRRDARGRKQYRYHADYRAKQDASKFDGCREFGEALPKLRKQVEKDLKKRKLSRETVLAAVVRRYTDVPVEGNDVADALLVAAIGARQHGEPLEASLPATHLKALEGVQWSTR